MERVSNWEGEWRMVGPNSMSGGPTHSWFDGGAAQKELPTNKVDQLLLVDASDSDLSGQSVDYGVMEIRPSSYLSPPSTDSASNSLPLWNTAYSSTLLDLEQATGKRKRDPDHPDLDQEKFTLLDYTNSNARFKLIRDTKSSSSSEEAHNISFDQMRTEDGDVDAEAIQQMKEMIYRAAALRPVNLGEEEVSFKPRRKNVKISSDPQTVAARQRRERISDRLRLLQKLVPGGCKMDTASMLDEAANYLKFLRSQIKALQSTPASTSTSTRMMPPVTTFNLANYDHHHHHHHHPLAAAPITIPTMHLPDNNHLLLPHDHYNPTGLIHH